MTIAFAIVFSTILAISAWLIEKRSAWKKVGKFFAYALGVIVIVPLIGWAGYEGYEKLGEWNTARLVRNGSIDTYLGIRLGMTEQEVAYVLGVPTSREVDKDNPKRLHLEWQPDRWSDLVFKNVAKIKKVEVFSGSVREIGCSAEFSQDCPSLAGVTIGDYEGTVIQKLGKTLYEPSFNDEDPPEKRLRFGTSKRELQILFRQGKVSSMVLNERRQAPLS